jgi:hypothetical protein
MPLLIALVDGAGVRKTVLRHRGWTPRRFTPHWSRFFELRSLCWTSPSHGRSREWLLKKLFAADSLLRDSTSRDWNISTTCGAGAAGEAVIVSSCVNFLIPHFRWSVFRPLTSITDEVAFQASRLLPSLFFVDPPSWLMAANLPNPGTTGGGKLESASA